MDIDDASTTTTPAGNAAAPDDATAQQQKEQQEQQEREEREEREAGKAPPPSGPLDPNDPDPVVASYSVYMNPPPPPTRKLLVLQHPNKQGPQRDAYPTLNEVRIKPQNGMLEVDVPLNYADAGYDRDKGMRWGQALSRSMAGKGGGSHGLAGGFGVGVPAARQGARRREDDREIYDWSEAVRRDQVLRTQTLGGIIIDGDGRHAKDYCRYMVGVFKGSNLHLTPASAQVTLRPQLHHLDALTEQERRAAGAGGGAGAGGSAGAGGGPGAAPKAIQMTIKSGTGSGEAVTETMTDRLRAVQMEPWQKLRYVGEDEDAAWDLYNHTLHYGPALAADEEDAQGNPTTTKIPKPKSTAKPGSSGEDAMDVDADDDDEKATLEHKVKLQTQWMEEDYMRAVAGKDRAGVLEGYGSTVLPGVKADDEGLVLKKEEDRPASAALRGTPVAAAAKGKAKATPAAAPAGGAAAKRAVKK